MRRILQWFEKEKMIKICPIRGNSFLNGADPRARIRAYLGIKIKVSNYDTYQNPGNYKGRDKGGPTSLLGQINNNKDKKDIKKDPSAISSEIASLVSKLFPAGRELVDQVVKAFSSTRKTGKVSDSIILAQLKAWEKYPPEQVESGIRTYLERAYHLRGKDEKYLLGIIRNYRQQEGRTPQEFKSTGSPALDRYFREQAAQGGES